MPKFYRQLSKSIEGAQRLQIAPFVEEVTFGIENEMAMRWYQLRDWKKPSPKLEVYAEGFCALTENQELFEELSRIKDIQPDEFCNLLKKHDFLEK